MRLFKQFAIVAAAGLTSLGMASGAWAYFSAAGTAEGAARVGTVNPPTAVTAVQTTPAAGTVHVRWSAPTAPGGLPLSGYYVERLLGSTPIAACASSPGTLLAAGASACDDTGVTSGAYTYRVTAVFRSFDATSDPAPVTVDVTAPAL